MKQFFSKLITIVIGWPIAVVLMNVILVLGLIFGIFSLVGVTTPRDKLALVVDSAMIKLRDPR